jgi:uridine kinase
MIGFVGRASEIGIAGGTGSGKTTVTEAVIPVAPEYSTLLRLDHCYRGSARLSCEESLEPSHVRPHAFDLELGLWRIRRTVSGRPSSIPVYWFKEYTRAGRTIETRPAPVAGFEGKMLSVGAALAALMKLEVFVEANARSIRGLQRGQIEPECTTDGVLEQYLEHPCPMQISFVATSERKADATKPHSGHDPEAPAILTVGFAAWFLAKKVGRRGSWS